MNSNKIAYIREYETKNCDLRMILVLKQSNGEPLEKEIIGCAKVTDTLFDLKKSVQEKIFNLNANENGNESEKEKQLFDLPANANDIEVVFHRFQKIVQETRTLQDFIKNISEDSIQVLGQKFSISANAPLVRQIRLPFSIYADFSVEPLKLNCYNMEKQASKFIWLKSLDKISWVRIGEGYQYKVDKTDVDHYIKLVCVPYSQYKVKGPSAETISENVVETISDLPKCPFEDRHLLTKQRPTGDTFRVVSYNVLADRYVDGTHGNFSCLPKALGIHYRKQLIVKELKGYNSDIICLQEVDQSQYKEYYCEELKQMGYKSFYNRKGNCIPEGLVFAFNTGKFKLMDSKHIVLRTRIDDKRFNDVLNLLNINQDVKTKFLQQPTSLQVGVIQNRKTKSIAIVGNTHLYYHPDANDIRLLQAFMATIFLNSIKNAISREYPRSKVAVLFCGDFNSDFTKSLYGFMVSGTISPKHEDCLKISPDGDARLHHRFYFESACGTPKYTNYTEDFKGCLDYIFIEKSKLRVSKIVPVPTETELQQYKGLPNEYFPSDHLALVVDLEFIRT